MWAARIQSEAKFHAANCFITLTYDNEHLPDDYCVSVREHQLFMKKLREEIDQKVRFYMCGEYGDKGRRPHYHYCLFGYDFPDRRPWKQNKRGEWWYTSELLKSIWGKGHVIVADLTFESAAYTARYVTKKLKGSNAPRGHDQEDAVKKLAAYNEYKKVYDVVHPVTGELCHQIPEFCKMSLKPGIGHQFYQKFKSDMYPHDWLIIKGRKHKPPRYFDTLYEIDHPDDFERLKAARAQHAADAEEAHPEEFSNERLKVKEAIQALKAGLLRRPYEEES